MSHKLIGSYYLSNNPFMINSHSTHNPCFIIVDMALPQILCTNTGRTCLSKSELDIISTRFMLIKCKPVILFTMQSMVYTSYIIMPTIIAFMLNSVTCILVRSELGLVFINTKSDISVIIFNFNGLFNIQPMPSLLPSTSTCTSGLSPYLLLCFHTLPFFLY